MYEASDIEQVAPVAGGVVVVLRGDYPNVGASSRERIEVEFSTDAIQKLVSALDPKRSRYEEALRMIADMPTGIPDWRAAVDYARDALEEGAS